MDTDALIERYRKEIEDLKSRLAEKEADAPVRTRRLSAREQVDESKAMKDLNSRIQQLTKLILTSQTVDESKGDESRPSSPLKIDFDMSPYEVNGFSLPSLICIHLFSASTRTSQCAYAARKPSYADSFPRGST